MKYEVIWVATAQQRRDYRQRQEYANEQGCDVYVEQHFNAKEYDRPGLGDNPSFCLVGSNASQTSKALALTYSEKVSAEFGTEDQGYIQTAFRGRGDLNLRFTEMPAFLPEPLFVSDPELALIAMSDVGQRKLARCLAETIREHFPAGARVGLSVGHLFKVSQPYDRGAPVAGTGGKVGEGDLALPVLQYAAQMLQEGEDVEPEPPTEPQHIELEGVVCIQAVAPGRLRVWKHGPPHD